MKEVKLNLIQFILIIFAVIVITALVVIEVIKYQAGVLEVSKLPEEIIDVAVEENSEPNKIELEEGEIYWEEYPKNVKKEIYEMDAPEIPFIIEFVPDRFLKTVYSVAKNHANYVDILCTLYGVGGDTTEIIRNESNYDQYVKELEEAEIKKYANKILYKVATFEEDYYHYNWSEDESDNFKDYVNAGIDELTKYQYDNLSKLEERHGSKLLDIDDYFYQIDNVVVMNGNNTSKEDFLNNSRAKKIKITIDNDYEKIIELEDTNKAQYFELNYRQTTVEKPVEIEVEVLETYLGVKSDVYISDIQFGIESNIPQGR